MTEHRNYLESHRNLRAAVLVVGFIIASVLLYMAITAYLFIQYSDVLIAALLFSALSFNIGMAWFLQQKAGRGFWLNIVFTSVAILAGAIVVSMVVWHGHWAVTIKELLRELR
jgi:hypothetical protein